MVGLGPAGPDLITAPVRRALDRIPHRYLRTRRHPAASAVEGAPSFDHLYDSAATFEEVYAGIVEALVGAAAEHGEVLYAVPGSPLVLERTVALLGSDPRVEVEVLAALSFLDLAWAALGVDPVADGVRLVDGQSFSVQAAGERGPLLVAHCWSARILSDIKLAVETEPEEPVVILARLGLADQAVATVPWADLDRAVVPDHLTSLFIPSLAAPVGMELAKLGELVRVLRQRCPWDRAQTHASLRRHLVEETYEVLEAIDSLGPAQGGRAGGDWPDAAGDAYRHLEEELGDVLFQVYFHAALATEAGQFGLADVARGVHDKLVGRHPHVFATAEAKSPEQVVANWEQIKQAEKGRRSLTDGIPPGLPALLAATKLLGKADSAGLGQRTAPVLAEEVRSDLDAIAVLTRGGDARPPDPAAAGPSQALGRVLLALVGLSRRLGVDPEEALRWATARYRDRLRALEDRAQSLQVGLDELTPAEVESLWVY